MPKILLVEDNVINREMLTRRLTRRGFTILEVEAGQEAIDQAASAKPDLILMDIGLPDMSGVEATRRIRAAETPKHTPIIALTAHALEGERIAALAGGCDAFVTKPIDLESLLVEMNLLLIKGDADAR